MDSFIKDLETLETILTSLYKFIEPSQPKGNSDVVISKRMEMIEIRMNQVTLMVQQMMQSLRIWMIFNESASIHDDMVKNDIKNLQDTFKSATLMLSRLEDHVMDIDQLHQTVSNAASTLLQVRDKMESFAKVVQSLQFPVKLSPEEQEWEESRGWVNS